MPAMEPLDPVFQEKLSYSESLRQDDEVYRHWEAIPTEESVSSELRDLVRADLQKRWFYEREWTVRYETKRLWDPVDGQRTVLKDSIVQVESRHIRYMCNKATAFYWLQSAQFLLADGQDSSPHSIIFASLYEEWSRCYDEKPHIDFGHFFANPVRITSSGPSTIRGVLDAHYSLQMKVSSLMQQARDGIIQPPVHDMSTFQYYSILPLYRAIVVIADRQDGLAEGIKKEANGWVSLYKIARRQTVLVVRPAQRNS